MQEPKVVTLANLADCSEQDVFDHVCYRLAQQGFRQSVGPNLGVGVLKQICYYRNADGCRCAAGHLMTDAEHDALAPEGAPWSALVEHEVVPAEHQDLISHLQEAHDESSGPDGMRTRLADVGRLFNLSTRLLDGANV